MAIKSSEPIASTSNLSDSGELHSEEEEGGAEQAESESESEEIEIPKTTFSKLGVEPFLCRALEVMSIRSPTGVQAACIPPILSG